MGYFIFDVRKYPYNKAFQDIVNYRLMNARKNGTDAIKKIIFNQKACIVFWKDGTKTVVKRKENDKFDKYAAVAQAIVKHQLWEL